MSGPESLDIAEAFLDELDALTKKYGLVVGMHQYTEQMQIFEAREGRYRFKRWDADGDCIVEWDDDA
jgi:hypothetical protein